MLIDIQIISSISREVIAINKSYFLLPRHSLPLCYNDNDTSIDTRYMLGISNAVDRVAFQQCFSHAKRKHTHTTVTTLTNCMNFRWNRNDYTPINKEFQAQNWGEQVPSPPPLSTLFNIRENKWLETRGGLALNRIESNSIDYIIDVLSIAIQT